MERINISEDKIVPKHDACSKDTNSFPSNFGEESEVPDFGNGTRPSFGSRFLKEGDNVYRYNAWDDVPWDEEQKRDADAKLAEHLKNKLSLEEYNKVQEKANIYWDRFYDQHKDNFYKNRNWIFREFPEVSNAKTIFEVGCGVGNTVFPILQENDDPELRVYCCDFSSSAISILSENPLFEPRCIPFICDLTESKWLVPFEPNSLDVIIMIFVLSSIPPENMEHVLKQLKTYLKPGGLILLRDYGRYDLSQLRFKDGKCIAENYYLRGEKTLVYFFNVDELAEMFEKCGYEVVEKRADRRLLTNRKRQLKMYRVWTQGKFRRPL